MDLWQSIGTDSSDPGGWPSQWDALLGRQSARSATLAIGRLCSFDVAAADAGGANGQYAIAASGPGPGRGRPRCGMGAPGDHHERLHDHHEGCQLRLLAAALALSLSAASAASAAELPRRLVVCADPNNLPFSNRARQGFENKIIDIVASDLGAQVSYVWWAQRRGYVRSTLGEAKCDLWSGV